MIELRNVNDWQRTEDDGGYRLLKWGLIVTVTATAGVLAVAAILSGLSGLF